MIVDGFGQYGIPSIGGKDGGASDAIKNNETVSIRRIGSDQTSIVDLKEAIEKIYEENID